MRKHVRYEYKIHLHTIIRTLCDLCDQAGSCADLNLYRHGMGLRKIYVIAVYGITHTKQLCMRKPVKYEYK